MYFFKIFFTFIFCALFFSACFGGPDPSGSVRRFHAGVVETVDGSFRIGTLSSDWQVVRIKAQALLFQQQKDSATMTISSWCHGAFDDGNLSDLSDEITHALTKVQKQGVREFSLDGVVAREERVTGQMDEQKVFLKSVVIKKHGCVFDFTYVDPTGTPFHENEFDDVVNGFHLLRAPGVFRK